MEVDLQVRISNATKALGTVAAICGLASATSAQTLDKQAWNAVWDRLETILPADTPTESVHALTVMLPVTWAVRTDPEGLRELARLAGAIPDEKFSIDPSRMKLFLHRAYSNYALDVDLPLQDPSQESDFHKAQTEYNTAYTSYLTKLDDYEARWDKRVTSLRARGAPVDAVARMRFRQDMRGFFQSTEGDLQSAQNRIQKFAPVNDGYARSVGNLRQMVSSIEAVDSSVWDYDGGFATLTAMGDDCSANGPGWDKIEYSLSTTSQHDRNSSWNGNGSWGAFFSIDLGGGSSDASHAVHTNTQSVSLRFCKLTYIPLSPGDWFDPSLIQALDTGALKLKQGSAARLPAFGPQGAIPRLVKGAIIARSVQFDAKLDDNDLSEVRKSYSGGGGFGFGPWHIGGSAGGSSFDHVVKDESGEYARSTNFNVPVIIAIITEPTADTPGTPAAPAPPTKTN